MPLRDIIGHQKLVRLLARAIRGGTLPPSLIFAGPAGVGKRTVALAVAQAFNCTQVTGAQPHLDVDACGVCAACTRIARGVHPDVLLIRPGDTGTIKIEEVRTVIDSAAFRPFEGRRRVVIIDEADRLVAPAQNALLKTLEEPPPSSVFLLVADRPDTLLPTVRSRCPRLQFRALGPDEVAAALVRQGRSAAEAHAVAAAAGGSIGRALQASGSEQVAARDVAARVLARTGPLAAGDARRRLEGSKDLLAGLGRAGASGASDREQLSSYLRAMGSLIRDAALLAARADDRALANPDVLPVLERLKPYQGRRGVRAFAAVDEALTALDKNAGVKVVADWLVLQL
jgi:DNA polymerase-3 subunit delta'